jgi:hypothetical protein
MKDEFSELIELINLFYICRIEGFHGCENICIRANRIEFTIRFDLYHDICDLTYYLRDNIIVVMKMVGIYENYSRYFFWIEVVYNSILK